ncbi:MAG: rhomboid family intramembrane serine protease [Candidatus Hydrogenedentes bacterium]|nr:rhomboid family intramembrane serine protease [Candidatus Hydrogenedentota bacterium]
MSRYSFYSENAGVGSPRITWAVQRLIFICIAVFALQLVLEPLQAFLFQADTLKRLLSFHPGYFLRAQIWRAFSYQFLHDGLLHLFMNMLWLFFFGPDVERVLGTRGFFRFFLACGTVGVLATLFPYLLTGAAPWIVGASGGVMGVLVAFALIDPHRQFFLFPIPMPITAAALVVIIIVLNLISALQNDPVSVATHFGGMGVGYLYMKILPNYNAWLRGRRRSQMVKARGKSKLDKIGEEVDNIFKLQDRDKK